MVLEWKIHVKLRPLTVDIHLTLFWVLDVVLLSHDDVLDVFHGQVIAEGVVQQPLQLLYGQLLHVTLKAEKGLASAPSTARS